MNMRDRVCEKVGDELGAPGGARRVQDFWTRDPDQTRLFKIVRLGPATSLHV